MTPDERTLLQTFLADLAATAPAAKDPEADAMIQEAMRRNPNAAYLLVQHAILADQALHAAQAQLAAQQVQPRPASCLRPPHLGGFRLGPAPPARRRSPVPSLRAAASAASCAPPEPWRRAWPPATSWPRASPTSSPHGGERVIAFSLKRSDRGAS